MVTLLHIEERPPAPSAPAGWALWALGFRPFYLLAAGLAALSVPLWALQWSGLLARPYLAGAAWHAHEMVFGFALAVVVGFLFTAGRNWSGQPTPTGRPLMALAALWLAARVLVLTPWGVAAAVANTAFAFAAAWGLRRALKAGGNRRNDFFVALLAAMGMASALVHAVHLGVLAAPPLAGVQLGLDLVLFIMAVMGGRVIPMFTMNGVPGVEAVRHPQVERVALGAVLVLPGVDALQAAGWGPAWLPAPVLAVALVAHAVRWGLWQPWRTLRTPLVGVLHVAYAWILVHLALRLGALAGAWAPSLATHALTVGAIGGLTIGMMTRTARGHTARPLRADRLDIAAYAAVLAAALVRVGLPLVAPALLREAVLASALLWSAGFALYALHYGPWLVRPRLDGRPG